MASVTLTWTGRATDRAVQDELLGYLAEIAEQSVLLGRDPAALPLVSHILAAQRAEGVVQREAIEQVDFVVRGPTVVNGDVMGDPDAFIEAAKAAGLEPATDGGWARITLNEVAVRGVDFRLYDPRRLYPGADRLSFVFLDTPDVPFLDGRLVSQIRAEYLHEGHPARDAAYWYVECPSIMLRYVLEGWTQRLLAWVKYFFIPDLVWNGWGTMQYWDEEQKSYDRLVPKRGRDAVKREAFARLKQGMVTEATDWRGQFAAMEGASKPN